MWKKLKKWYIQLNLDEEIEHYCVELDLINEEIEIEYDSLNIEVPKKLLAEQKALTNIVRRLKNLKEKYI